MIELDQPQYIGFESTEMTEQICARLTIDLTQIVSLEDTFEDLFGSPTATISATITSIQTNDATGNYTNVTYTIMSDKLLLTGEKKRKREGERGGGREEKERREGERRDVCLNVYEGLMHISTSVLFFVSRKCRFCY